MSRSDTWVPAETCAALVREAIRETLTGRFFKGTVEETLRAAQRKVDGLLDDLDQAERDPRAHYGPVTLDCEIACLGLSTHAYNRLTRFNGMKPQSPPKTIADVLALAEAGRLGDITGIGKTYAQEIEDALRRLGFSAQRNEGHDHDDSSPSPEVQPSPDSKEAHQ
ncbi:hypothetical protein SMC26_40225 [Actinomadura fulvescens]|uniref:Uncharacterized protein n=1 Tax=Actinomadura fulvescens TaxID=46160 RepID=A0ABN3Q6W0_9ACTN